MAEPGVVRVRTEHPTRYADGRCSGVRARRRAPASAPGGAGELYIGGDLVARGYVGEPGRTAEAFLPDPFAGRAGRACTAPATWCVRWRMAGTSSLGRADRQVKVSGHRVEPAAVEAMLERHPGVGRRRGLPGCPPRRVRRASLRYAAGRDGVACAPCRRTSPGHAAGRHRDPRGVATALQREARRGRAARSGWRPLLRTPLARPPRPKRRSPTSVAARPRPRRRSRSPTASSISAATRSCAIHLVSLARKAGIPVRPRRVRVPNRPRPRGRVDAGATHPAQSLPDARLWWSALLDGSTPLGLSRSVGSTTATIPSDVLDSLGGTAHAAYGTTDARTSCSRPPWMRSRSQPGATASVCGSPATSPWCRPSSRWRIPDPTPVANRAPLDSSGEKRGASLPLTVRASGRCCAAIRCSPCPRRRRLSSSRTA